ISERPKPGAHPARIIHRSRVRPLGNDSALEAGLAFLSGPPDLHQLWIGETKITDSAGEQLKQVKSLRRLEMVNNPQLTDAVLRALETHPQLDSVNVRDCKGITDEGVKQLQRARPNFHVQVE